MRTPALAFASLFVIACGDGAAVERVPEVTPDVTGEVEPDAAVEFEPEVEPEAVTPDVFANDAPVEAGPLDVFDPQPDAWTLSWTSNLAPAGKAELLGIRYLGGGQGEAAGVIALIEADGADGEVAFTNDGGSTALAGEGHRVVIATLNPTTGQLLTSVAVALATGETRGTVTKAPNGFAVDLGARVVLGQLYNGVARVTEVTSAGTIDLPESRDLMRATSGGAATALALQLDGADELDIVSGEVSFTLPAGTGVGFLTLPARTAADVLPTEGAGLVLVPDFVASAVVETSLGPVVAAVATADTTIRTREIAAGDDVFLIGALPDAVATEEPVTDPSIAVVLWQGTTVEGNPAARPSVDLIQIASFGGGGLVLAGVGTGEVTLGETTRALASTPFVGSLGSSGAFIYEGSACDEILSVAAGFTVRVMRVSCDYEGGKALVMTVIGSDDLGESLVPEDALMVPLQGDAPKVLSGLISFTVTDGRAYGGLFDFGTGPRVVLVRDDGQFYDSGVIEVLTGAEPVSFQPLRQGGGGGGGGTNPATNAVLFVKPSADGVTIGRARLDLETFIR